MELLEPGTQIDAQGLRVGETLGGVLRIDQRLGDAPHGDVYRGHFESQPVLVTFIDPVLAAQADMRSWLLRNIARAATVEHRNLLVQHGTFIQGRKCFVVQAHPDGQTARQLLVDRAARGKLMDRDTAQTIVGHVCNALSALHQVAVHGNVTVDTVWVTGSGRVLLSDPGVGALVANMRRFERLHSTGRLPNVAPEQMLAPPPMSPGTDVFGVATLMLELATGRALPEAGIPVRALGLFGPEDLVLCLERATAPDVGARPPDVLTFKAELADALGGDAPLDLRAPERPPARARPVISIADPRMHSGLEPPRASPPPPPPPRTPPMMPGLTAPSGMPMMMPGAVPAGMIIPAGYSVIGVPMAGPGGVPTMVPVLIGTPTAAAVAPAAPASSPSTRARASAAASRGSDAMREFDLATRRIADSMPTDALADLTEDVAQSSTRLASELVEGANSSASASSLRLDVRSMEEATDRLETLDASDDGHEHRAPPPHAAQADGGFFSSFAMTELEQEAPPSTLRRPSVALDEDDMESPPRGYTLLGDQGPRGEHSLAALVTMVRQGKLTATDSLIHPLTQKRIRVIDVADLRVELGNAPNAAVLRLASPAMPVAQRPMLVQQSKGFGGTLLWIALVAIGFTAVGVVLWWRSSGG